MADHYIEEKEEEGMEVPASKESRSTRASNSPLRLADEAVEDLSLVMTRRSRDA